MENVGIDTIALQRFGDFRGTGQPRDVVAGHVRDAAQAHGRKFYIMYDISGWDTFQTDLKSDWTQNIVGELHLTDSPAYAKQNGKPVVCIWGVGYSGHPGTPQTTLDVITWFQGQGLYVIGGVGNDWRTADGTRWSQASFGQVFDTLDAISPWMVGIIGDDAETAATSAGIPGGTSFVTLDEDGTQCSSDYYLRLTGDGGKMLKQHIPLTATRPTSPM